MSDILVRGMEMSKCCNDCRFAWIDTDHHWYCEANKPWGLDITDHVMSKHPDCPLIEIPPHGRLIDADAINHEDEIWKKKCIPQQVVYNAWVVAGEMPTVIPADKDGED